MYRHNAIVASGVFPHFVGSDEGYKEVEALVAKIPELRIPINMTRVDEIFRREAIKIISAHPENYVELVLFRFFACFNAGGLEQYGQTMLFLDYLVIVQQAILLIAVWKGDWFLRMVALSVPFFMFGYMAIDSQLRYMIPIMQLIISLSVIDCRSFLTRNAH